jgi:hypothetical protein
MISQYTFLALELAKERMREAEAHNRRLVDSEGFRVTTPGLPRRALARAAASLSRGSAAVALRLDECVEVGDGSLRGSPTT